MIDTVQQVRQALLMTGAHEHEVRIWRYRKRQFAKMKVFVVQVLYLSFDQ